MDPLINIFDEAEGIIAPQLSVIYTPATVEPTSTDKIIELIKNLSQTKTNTPNNITAKTTSETTKTTSETAKTTPETVKTTSKTVKTTPETTYNTSVPDNTRVSRYITEIIGKTTPISKLINKKMEKFPTDTQLLEFLKKQEGTVALEWTDNNDNIITKTGVNGYDLPGGVHNPEIAKQAGITIESLNPQRTTKSRKAIQGERKNGATKAYYVNTNASNDYWNKLLKVYKTYIQKAWNNPKVQNTKSIAEKLAIAHIMAWRGNTKNPGPKDIAWNNAIRNANAILPL